MFGCCSRPNETEEHESHAKDIPRDRTREYVHSSPGRSSLPRGLNIRETTSSHGPALPLGSSQSLSAERSRDGSGTADEIQCPNIRRSGITVLYGDEKSVVDIVFVHGLNGSPGHTWKYSGLPNFFWPWELRTHIPDARVMLFGYDANISPQFGTNLIRIKGIAESLLSALVNKRQEDSESQRPLLFIGHSLGGLVIKKALVLASQALETQIDDAHLVYNSTKGIMFFGTPNAGSSLGAQTRIRILQNIARVSFTKVPPKLEEALSMHSDELLDLADDFRKLTLCTQKTITVYSYYEGNTTAKVGSRIVDETSARVNYDQETALPIQADHQSMVKFRNQDDAGYESARGKINILKKYAVRISSELNYKQKAFMDSFTVSTAGNRSNDVDTPMSETFKWILDDKKLGFLTWLNGRGPIYWIEGKPGSGKSTLMKYILLKAGHQRSESHIVVGYFFNHKISGELHSLHSFLRSLIYQILSHNRQALEYIRQEFPIQQDETQPWQYNTQMPHDSQFSWDTSTLKRIFQLIVLDVDSIKKITVVVDALDECHKVREFIEFIDAIVKACAEQGAQIKLCLSSRPQSDLTSFLSPYPRLLMQNHNGDDIQLYVEVSTRKFTESRETEAFQTLLKEIILKAEGVFLWARLAVESLTTHDSDGDTIFEMTSALKDIPKDLENVYEVIVGRIADNHRHEGKLMLKSILHAQRPLGWREIEYVVENGLGNVSPQQAFENTEIASLSYDKYKRRIQTRTGGLVEETSRSKTIQFIHQTAKDFVQVSAYLKGNGDTQSGDLLMLNACIERLASAANKSRYLPITQIRSLHFMEYATRFWIHHWKEVEKSGEECQNLARVDGPLLRVWAKCRNTTQVDFAANLGPDLTLLSLAAESNIYSYVARNLTPVNVNDPVHRYGTLLQAASAGGHDKIVTLLLANGADVNVVRPGAPGGQWGSALRAASYYGHSKVVTQLLDARADVNDNGKGWGTALQLASEAGHVEVVRQLLCAGADVNATGGRWGNALKAASYGGHELVVQTLLNAKAGINDQGPSQLGNALKVASHSGHCRVVELLIEQGANNPEDALCGACETGHYHVVSLLLKRGVDPNTLHPEYGNVLQLAAHSGYENIVTELISKGAEVNSEGGQYGTALQGAAYSRHERIVRQLLVAGANVNAQAGDFSNALQAGSYGGNIQVVQELLTAGADVNCEKGRWGTALKAASYAGHLDVVTLLLERGAKVDAQLDDWGNSLKAAALGGHVEVVKLLIQSNASDIKSARDTACEKGHDLVIEFLDGL